MFAKLVNAKSIYLAFCALIVLCPLFAVGYVMTMDMAWGPNYPSVTEFSNIWLLFKFLQVTSLILPGNLIQLFILVLVVTLAIVGINKLLDVLVKKRHLIAALVSVLYIYNPFFYSRFVAGQWLVLLGYALLPWAVRSIYLFVQNPRWKTAWPVAAWTAAIGLTSIHTIGIVAVVAVALLIYSGKVNWKPKLKYVGVIAGMWIAINAVWLVPFVTGQSSVSRNISSFSQSEMQAFATKPTVVDSVPISAALLTGFWADDQNRYILPSSLPIWYVGAAIVMALVIIGIVLVFRRKDRLGITFFVLAIIAWLLGMGIAWTPSAVLTQAITAVFPYFNGYREPQKWLMLLALCYVYFAAIAADRIYQYITETRQKDWVKYSFLSLLVLTPFLFAPTLAWGALGQLKSVDYPQGWYQTKSYLNSKADVSDRTNVLVFPWHIYLPVEFTGRVVANPSGYFFDQTMITSDNFELKGVPAQNPTPATSYISNQVLPNTPTITAVGQKLKAEYGIEYIMLLKEADWRNYAWLDRQTDLKKVVDNDSIVLYEIIDNTKN